MPRFQYLRLVGSPGDFRIHGADEDHFEGLSAVGYDDLLEMIGEDGWELVTVEKSILPDHDFLVEAHFKRAID